MTCAPPPDGPGTHGRVPRWAGMTSRRASAVLERPAALLVLDLFDLLIALMAGGVIPAFTANALSAARPRKNRYVEISAVLMLPSSSSAYAS